MSSNASLQRCSKPSVSTCAWRMMIQLTAIFLAFLTLTRSVEGRVISRQEAINTLIAPIANLYPDDYPYIPWTIPPYTLPHRLPSNKTQAEIRANNAARFPGVWLPDGYDVQEPAPQYSATAKMVWRSPKAIEMDVENEPRIWAQQFKRGQKLPPGKLLLNMLLMNEAEHLERTLPLWAKIVDYWIMGVDEKNTDNSYEIIKKYLGHLPGEICEVHFDGFGPTWNQVTQLGIMHFPGATHGILVDADYTPMVSSFSRDELNLRASVQVFPVFQEDGQSSRQLDWLYRNIPGARVTRRCHHTTVVPPQPDQTRDEYLHVTNGLRMFDKPGGFGDRIGGKHMRYAKWLELDLLEWPNDGHTLYYLGHAYYDYYISNPTPENAPYAHLAIEYFSRRAQVKAGSPEGRYWALVKIAELYAQYLRDPVKADEAYLRAIRMDQWRSEAIFYFAQSFVDRHDFVQAEKTLRPFTHGKIPPRSWFMWLEVYTCITKVEYARYLVEIRDDAIVTEDKLKHAEKCLRDATCSPNSRGWHSQQHLRHLVENRRQQRAQARTQTATPSIATSDRSTSSNKVEEREKVKEKEKAPKKDASKSRRRRDDDNDDDEDEEDDRRSRRRNRNRNRRRRSRRGSKKSRRRNRRDEDESQNGDRDEKKKDESHPSSADVAAAGTVSINGITRPKWIDRSTRDHLVPLGRLIDFVRAREAAIESTAAGTDGDTDCSGLYDRSNHIFESLAAATSKDAPISCRAYRLLTTPYLQLSNECPALVESEDGWKGIVDAMRTRCR